jgi:uncharacterized protein (DUF1330 family)
MREIPEVALLAIVFGKPMPAWQTNPEHDQEEETMAAYVISDVEVLDTALMVKYRSLAQATIAKYGGHYVVRGGAIEPVEGDWVPKHLVIVEFPTMEQAREWYHSTEYAEALKVRPRALNRRLIFVEGVPQSANFSVG